MTTKHPRDVTLTLPRLVDKGFLVASGEKRDKSYSLPGMEPPSPEDVFANALSVAQSLTHSGSDLTHSSDDLTHKDRQSEQHERDDNGRFISQLLDKPFIDSVDLLTHEFRQRLEDLTELSRNNGRMDTEVMKRIIIELCDGHYLSVAVMEILLGRKSQSIRQNYLKPMVDVKQIRLAFPNKPNSPKQGYTRY
jgi:hypothetical protein